MSSPLRFGRAEVRPAERQLLIDGRPAALGARAFDLLLALIEHRDRVVSKNELLDLVWPSLVVEENNLQVQISALRKLLGAPAISTIPGRGYQFAVPMHVGAGGSAPPKIGSVDVKPVAGSALSERSPIRLPDLIGRAGDLAALVQLLSQQALVTLAGPSGIGKTRLAAAALEVFRNYQQVRGAGWVDLAPLTDAALIPSTVAAAFRLPLDEMQEPLSALVAALKERSLLIVLDNCEHLIDAAAKVAAALVEATNHVRVLATSREALKVAGEQVYRLGPLAVPPTQVSLQEAASFDAVALFTARARAADRHFALSDKNIGQVVEICRRLDGIPLALELAAARVSTLGLVNLTAALDKRFQVLTGGGRTAPARHQTMLAAFDWSHDLLSVDEKTVFRRLGIFAGGFTLEAACAVTGDAKLDEWDVIDALARLVDLSLVVAAGMDRTRYSLLDTGRAYALKKLAEAGEVATVERQHANYFRNFIVDTYDSWIVGEESQWLTKAIPELDNLRGALKWALGPNGNAAAAIALAGSAMLIWLDRGVHEYSEGRQYVRAAIERLDSTADAKMEARLWLASGFFEPLTEVEAQLAAYERSLTLYRATHQHAATCLTLIVVSGTHTRLGNVHRAQEILEEARGLLKTAATPKLNGLYHYALGRHRQRTGSAPESLYLYAKAVSFFKAAGCEALSWLAQIDLSEAKWMLGDVNGAAVGFFAVVAEMRASSVVNAQALLGTPLSHLAGALIEKGDLDEATTVAQEALFLLREQDMSTKILYDSLALRLALIGRYMDAARLGAYVARLSSATNQPPALYTQRLRARLLAILQEHIETQSLDRLSEEGAQLSEEEAYRIAL